MQQETRSAAPEREPTLRVFIAINLPPEVKAPLAELQRELKSAAGGRAVRWTPAEQIHLTVRFLGNVPAVAVADLRTALARAVTPVRPFVLRAEGLGCFPNARQPRIVWAGLSGALDTLQQLQQNVESETAPWGEREDRAFHPHLTFGRVQPEHARSARPLVDLLATKVSIGFGTWRVEHVDLMQSKLSPAGAQHLLLAAIPLVDTDLPSQ